MLSEFELMRIAKLVDPAAGGMFRLGLKKAARMGAEEMLKKLLPLAVEFGFRQHEKGYNLEAALKNAVDGESDFAMERNKL